MCLISKLLKQYSCIVILLTTIIRDSRALYTFVSLKSIGKLLDISPKKIIFLKTFESKCLYIEVWRTDQNSKPLEIEDKISINLLIN